jgi:hypothetical protein
MKRKLENNYYHIDKIPKLNENIVDKIYFNENSNKYLTSGRDFTIICLVDILNNYQITDMLFNYLDVNKNFYIYKITDGNKVFDNIYSIKELIIRQLNIISEIYIQTENTFYFEIVARNIMNIRKIKDFEIDTKNKLQVFH